MDARTPTDQGWVKLHRKLLDNRILMHDHTALAIFIHVLLRVRRDGTYDTGRYKLAQELHINPNTLYSALKRLEKNGILSTQSPTRLYTVITICNWGHYQRREEASTTRQQPVNNVSTLKQEVRSKNKEKHIGFSFVNKELETAFDEFGLMRKTIKKPMTFKAAMLVIGRLGKIYPNNPKMQLASLEQSIEHCWQTVYPVKVDPATFTRNNEAPKPTVEISDEQRAKNLAKMAEIRKQLAEKGIIKKSL